MLSLIRHFIKVNEIYEFGIRNNWNISIENRFVFRTNSGSKLLNRIMNRLFWSGLVTTCLSYKMESLIYSNITVNKSLW